MTTKEAITVHGWFTPWVLFLVLNIVIGTIAVTSKASPPAGGGEGAAAAAGGERRSLSRVPSMAMDRLRSFNMSRFTVPAPEAPVTGVLDLGSDEQLPPLEMEPEAQGELEPEHTHMERSMSEAAAEGELPRGPARRGATEEIEEAGGEVDARADDFINNFRHQLKLQRIDSFMRYRDTLRRGQATAVASAEQ
uniref:Uncharacterized protein n=1 Tax=Aegilops tauschii TaxID=37682 RepID=N1R418_AEGTA